MIQKKNLIVFDIDGTLTDTVTIHQTAFKQSLNLIGVEKFDDRFGSYKHHTDSHIAKVIYEIATQKQFNQPVFDQFECSLFELLEQNEIKEINGAQRIVNHIEAETEFGICYPTGSLYRPAKLKLERIGINFHPMQLVASNEIEVRERIVSKAIEQVHKHYNVEKFERIISIGDGLWDLKTAENLSLEFIGIGKTNEAVLKANGMKKHFHNFENVTVSEW